MRMVMAILAAHEGGAILVDEPRYVSLDMSGWQSRCAGRSTDRIGPRTRADIRAGLSRPLFDPAFYSRPDRGR